MINIGPDVVWFAPGRVNLIGDHTDYNLGFAMPFAVHFGVTCAARRRDDSLVTVTSTQFDDTATFDINSLQPHVIDHWWSYVAGVAYEMRERGYARGADLTINGDVPLGAGMSSSAALSCATSLALNDLNDAGLPLGELAVIAQMAEHKFAGTPCGLLDQTASLRSQRDHVLLVDFKTMDAVPYPLDLASEGLALLVIDTRAPHRLVDGEYAKRRSSCESAARELGVSSLREVTDPNAAAHLDDERARRVRHVVHENALTQQAAALLKAGRIRDIGPLLTASHVSLRDDYEVTIPELDVAQGTAIGHGALGARMTGGGFGGSVVALVSHTAVADVTKAVQAAFARHGFNEPHIIEVRPSAGAHKK